MAIRQVIIVALACLSLQVLAKPPTGNEHDHLATDEVHFDGGEHNPEYDHEAFAGAEANEFNQMEPETAKAKLRFVPVLESTTSFHLFFVEIY